MKKQQKTKAAPSKLKDSTAAEPPRDEDDAFSHQDARELVNFLRPSDGWTVEILEELLAAQFFEADGLSRDVEELTELLRSREFAIKILFDDFSDNPHVSLSRFEEIMNGKLELPNKTIQRIKKGLLQQRSTKGQRNAEARHGAPNGYRAKGAAVRLAWASGKYASRDRCAEEVSHDLGISFSTARKALRNTPDPKKN